MRNILKEDIGSPVAGLVILDHPLSSPITGNSRILLANRVPESNPIHPNVISTITMRVRHALVDLEDVDRSFLSGDRMVSSIIGNNSANISAASLVTQKILELKLGGLGIYNGRVLQLGFASIKTDIPVGSEELITMYSMFAHIEDADFPNKTAHYDDIGWRNIGEYLQKKNDSGKPECVGLCNATARIGLAIHIEDDAFLGAV